MLGAQARIRALGLVRMICKMASTTVTVFPVPGLDHKQVVLALVVVNITRHHTHGPKIMNGTVPGRRRRMRSIAWRCLAFVSMRRLTAIHGMAGAASKICVANGRSRRPGAKAVSSAWCCRLRGKRFNLNLMWKRSDGDVANLGLNRRRTVSAMTLCTPPENQCPSGASFFRTKMVSPNSC